MIELAEHLEALYDSSIVATALALHGCRIGDEATQIDRRLVTATVREAYPDPALIWPEDFRKSPESFAVSTSVMASPDYYYFMSEEQYESYRDSRNSALRESASLPGHEWLLADRINHVIEFGGKLILGEQSYSQATGYRIKEGRITIIDLNVRQIPYLTGLSPSACISLFGTPDYYHEDPYEYPEDDYASDPTIEIGYNRGIYICCSQWGNCTDRLSIYPGGTEWITARKLDAYIGPSVAL